MPSPIRILIVDDDVDFLQSQKRLFEQRGFSVLCACSETDARNALREHKAKMDVSLIDMDIETSDSGLKLVELIAKDYSDIVSVVLAGKGAVENAVLSLQAGAFTYILKGETEPALVCEVVPKAATYGCQSRDLQQSLQEAREALRKVAGDFSHAMETLLRVAEELQKLTLKRPHD